MPDEDKNFGGALVLDFRKRWRHLKTIFPLSLTFSVVLITNIAIAII